MPVSTTNLIDAILSSVTERSFFPHIQVVGERYGIDYRFPLL